MKKKDIKKLVKDRYGGPAIGTGRWLIKAIRKDLVTFIADIIKEENKQNEPGQH